MTELTPVNIKKMRENATSQWRTTVSNYLHEFKQLHGTVPPPWFVFPNNHPHSIHWRMGGGEIYMMAFPGWWRQEFGQVNTSERIDYFRQWHPPACWLGWMIIQIWDLPPSAHGGKIDSSYFSIIETEGFGTHAQYVADLKDPKWRDIAMKCTVVAVRCRI